MNFKSVISFILIVIITTNICYSKDKAVEWLEKGIKAIDPQEKIRCFEMAIEYNPLFVDAHYNLGLANFEIGDFNKAENAFNRALRVSPDNIDNSMKVKIITELGKTYSQLERHQFAIDALSYARELVQNAESKSIILYELGNLYITKEEYDRAITVLEEGVKLNSQNLASVKTKLKQARDLKKIKTESAKKLIQSQQTNLYDTSVTLSRNIEANSNKKDMDTKLNQNNISAIEKQRQLLNSQPPNNQIQFQQRMNEDQQKVTEYQKDNLLKLYNRGMMALNSDNWEVATYCFQQVQKIDPNYKDVNSRLIEAKIGLESSQEFQKAVAFYEQGLIKFNQGEWQQAIDEFERAKMLYPGYEDVEFKIAEAKKYIEENQRSFTTIMMKSPAKPQKRIWYVATIVSLAIVLLFLLVLLFSPMAKARFYLLWGKIDRACKLYERILVKHPEETKAYICLANIYMARDRRDDKALQIYENALKAKLDTKTKEKIITVIGNEYLRRNILNQDSVKVLTQVLQNEIKRVEQDT